MNNQSTTEPLFFDRDLSWLGFNDLVLAQAAKKGLPVLEQIKFLAIYSSNLDEFYRVRIPVLLAVDKINARAKKNITIQSSIEQATAVIQKQLATFGEILIEQIVPSLKKSNIDLSYSKPLAAEVLEQASAYFYSELLAFIQPVYLSKSSFYPKNNELYFLVVTEDQSGSENLIIINIPSNKLSRFLSVSVGSNTHILFIDDILKHHLPKLFKNHIIKGCYSFKVTRDAELDLKDDYNGDIAKQIEKQLAKRDMGFATRFLYQPGIPLRIFEILVEEFKLQHAILIEGGIYHNLKDFFSFPVKNTELSNIEWPPIKIELATQTTIFEQVAKADMIVHTPYISYEVILRFFNEAAADADVAEIYVSLYRVASDSRIVNSLISAVKNGKKVVVLVELKARFDEANNIKWAKKLKAAGAQIFYSVSALKVHAKIALVKRQHQGRMQYFGLLGTGNFNEGTAKVYTDHILMTANHDLLREVELLFIFLAKRVKPEKHEPIAFKHLLVSKFNLQQRFIELIDQEIESVRNGKPASIIIKINNLEERVLIAKLYEASIAGVKINIIVRGICCLVPGIENMSTNITITRIVDRYLEHGRVFIFHNDGDELVYLGSADWMNRNIYHRIEVCFPVVDANIRQQITDIISLQLKDNVQAVMLDNHLNNNVINTKAKPLQSQLQIFTTLRQKSQATN